MNIDERIAALTQSVELLASLHKDNEEKFEKRMAAIDQRMAATDKQIKRLGKYIHSIGTLVLDHETRLRSLEDDENDEDEETQH
jgi:septal ring factor EnvC (AmiA/AmiB activator)